MTGTEVAQRTPAQELVARVNSDGFKLEVSKVLPEGMSVDRFARVAITAVLEKPEIATYEQNSVFRALIKCASDGLLPDGKEAALVPFNNKGTTEAQYMPMITGLRKRIAEYGWLLRTAIVHENDVFEYELGWDPRIKHLPTRPGHDPGDIIAAYAVASHKDGRKEMEVMALAEIEKVRKTSKAANRGPWVDWYEAMCEKTVGRRLFKKIGLSEADLQHAVFFRDELSNGEAATLIYGGEHSPTPSPATPEDTGHVVGTDGEPGEAENGSGEPAETLPAPDPATGSAGGMESEENSEQEGLRGPDHSNTASRITDEPETGEEAEDIREQMAEACGSELVTNGKHKGKTINAVAHEDRGEGWLLWLLQQPNHPNNAAARTYASVFFPELLGAAGPQTKGDDGEWKVQ